MNADLLNAQFVCARFDRDPTLRFQIYFYDESVHTRAITLRGKQGVAIPLEHANSVSRAKNDGWTDITEDIKKIRKASEEAAQKPKGKPRKKKA